MRSGSGSGGGTVSRALDARLGRAAERLVRAGALRFPAGAVEGWPAAELRRLGRMVEAGGALQRAAWARLSDGDLRWVAAFWLGEAEADDGI